MAKFLVLVGHSAHRNENVVPIPCSKGKGLSARTHELSIAHRDIVVACASRETMAILRHSKISTTMEIYAKATNKKTLDALQRLGEQFEQRPEAS